MYKLISFLFLMVSFILISCGDNNSENNGCDTKCKDWEYCDASRNKCRLNENACNEAIDCIRVNDICKDNQCLTPVVCAEWEEYIEDTNTCKLLDGRCIKNEQCTLDNQHCDINTKTCKDDLEITWSTDCPSYLSASAECSTVKLPMDYNNPDGKTMDVFIFRHKSKSANVKGQIWFLQGGPGGSGSIFSKYYFDTYLQRYPDYDFYSLDHRGVANSSRLTCEKEDTMSNLADLGKCVDELDNKLGDDLHEYSTTNSAKDVGYLLDVLKENNKKRFVYGVSYGTYWAERYLTIFPDQADGVILDSICTLGNCYMDDYSYWTDVVGKQFMDVCADDTTCKSKMDTINPTGTKEAMMDLLNKMDTTPCDFGYGTFRKGDIQAILTRMLMNWYTRILIPPTIYRLNRCETRDKTALKNLVDNLFGAHGGKKNDSLFVTEDEMNSNNVLYYNIVFSELWYGRTKEEIQHYMDISLFNTGDNFAMYDMKMSGQWNEYTDEYIAQTTPETNTPILMMNGTLDPQTALEIALPSKDFLNKEHQYFITFPQTPHGVSSESITAEMISNFGQGISCGEKMIFEFIDNPLKQPNQDCLNDLVLLSWGNISLNRGMGYQFYGTPDIWEGTPAKSGSLSSKFSKSINESIERTNAEIKKYPRLLNSLRKIQEKIK